MRIKGENLLNMPLFKLIIVCYNIIAKGRKMENPILIDLVKNLQKVITEDKIDDDVYFEIAKQACNDYAEIYLKPFIAGTKDKLVPLKFERGSKKALSSAEEVANYDPATKTITINMGYITDGENNIEKFVRLLAVMRSVGHEYEHSFQHQYTYYNLLNRQSKVYGRQRAFTSHENITKSEIYKDVIGSRAEEIADDFLHNPYSKEQIKIMLDFFKGLKKDMSTIISDEESAEDVCAYAVYFKRAVEEDARKKEIQIFKKFINDIKQISSLNPKFVEIMGLALQSEELREDQEQQRNTPIAEKINKLMDNISEKDFVAFAKILQNENLISMKESHLFTNPQDSYADFFVKQKILAEAFRFIFLKKTNATQVWGDYKLLNSVRLAFLKHGLGAAVALVEQEDFTKHMPVELQSRFRDNYYLMLRDQPITMFSFDKIDVLSDEQKLSVLDTFIKQGKYNFANSFIQSFDNVNRFLRTEDIDVEEKLKKLKQEGDSLAEWEYMEYIAPVERFNILGTIDKRLQFLESEQKAGRLCYDDIDEMIGMLATLCDSACVPYYKENAVFSEEDEKSEVARKLYSLYKKAEEIGYEKVRELSGRTPLPDEYRYAHSADRENYLLKGRAKEKRIEKVYGKNELARIQRENNIEKKYDTANEYMM